LLPEGPEYLLPSGVLKGAGGKILYTTADDGTGLTREDWVETFGYDPVIVLENMRRLGKEGVEGYFNTSSLGKRKAK
jgi:hypothetical protein